MTLSTDEFAIPDRIAVDAKGYGWRVWNGSDYWSMVPTNPDNSPIPEPVVWFVRADLLDEVVTWLGAEDWRGPQLPVELARRIAAALGTVSLCGECGGTLVDHRCVDCGTKHNEGAPEDDPELDEHYGPCCDEGTCEAPR